MHLDKSDKFMLLIAGVSFMLHGALLIVLAHAPSRGKVAESKKIAVKLTNVEKPKPTPPPEPKQPELTPPPPPKPKVKPKPNTVRANKNKKKQKSNEQPPQPVLGLSPNSLNNKGTMAAPVGNTTMDKDRGLRLRPEQVQALDKDLSQDASLILSSVRKPSKTERALDAGLIGRYVVDVYVNEAGLVTAAEIPKKIGYGMDDLVRKAALQARFKPRRNAKGFAIPGWTQIVFRFTED